jgi:hypothetical protein
MRAGALALLWHPPVLFHYSFKCGIYAEKMVERISKEFGEAIRLSLDVDHSIVTPQD